MLFLNSILFNCDCIYFQNMIDDSQGRVYDFLREGTKLSIGSLKQGSRGFAPQKLCPPETLSCWVLEYQDLRLRVHLMDF